MNGVSNEQIQKIIEKYSSSKEKLISILLDVQAASIGNYISENAAKTVAEGLGISISKVFDVITFYSMLNLRPRGKYIIEICKSAPCHINKSEKIAAIFENILNIKVGETTPDNIFTLQYTSCIGSCDIGPAVKIDQIVYGNLTEEKIHEIISLYKEEAK